MSHQIPVSKLISLIFLPSSLRDINGLPLKAEIKKNLVRNARYLRFPIELACLPLLVISGLPPGWPLLWVLGGIVLIWFTFVDIFNTIRTFDTQMLFNAKYYLFPFFESLIVTGIIFGPVFLFGTLYDQIMKDFNYVALILLVIAVVGGITLAFGGSLYLLVKELSQDEESSTNQIKKLEKEVSNREKYIHELDHQISELERVTINERNNELLTLLIQKKTWATVDIGMRESRIKRIEDNNSRHNTLLWIIRIVPPVISAVGILLINLISSLLPKGT